MRKQHAAPTTCECGAVQRYVRLTHEAFKAGKPGLAEEYRQWRRDHKCKPAEKLDDPFKGF